MSLIWWEGLCVCVCVCVCVLLTMQLQRISYQDSSIEAQQRQHTRLLQTIIAALQSSGADGSYQLLEGVVLPIKTLQELLNLEKALEDEQINRKLVSSSETWERFFLRVSNWLGARRDIVPSPLLPFLLLPPLTFPSLPYIFLRSRPHKFS